MAQPKKHLVDKAAGSSTDLFEQVPIFCKRPATLLRVTDQVEEATCRACLQRAHSRALDIVKAIATQMNQLP